MNMAEIYLNRQKTIWVEEKLHIKSSFYFSHSIFKRLELQTRKNQGLFGKGLMHFCDVFYEARHHLIMDP